MFDALLVFVAQVILSDKSVWRAPWFALRALINYPYIKKNIILQVISRILSRILTKTKGLFAPSAGLCSEAAFQGFAAVQRRLTPKSPTECIPQGSVPHTQGIAVQCKFRLIRPTQARYIDKLLLLLSLAPGDWLRGSAIQASKHEAQLLTLCQSPLVSLRNQSLSPPLLPR